LSTEQEKVMAKPVTVLVLGVGGNVSQGILKSLALGSLRYRVIGACISPLSCGLYTVDQAHVSPRADDPSFLDWLLAICRRENVRAVLSGVEPVLDRLAAWAAHIRAVTGAVCLVSPPDCLSIGNDKLQTCRWLQDHGLNAPRHAAADDRPAVEALLAQCGFPLIAKPRCGKSSQGVLMVRCRSQLELLGATPGYLLQEYLADADREYTVGCFCDRGGKVCGSIVMKRELLEGTTHRAVVVDDPAVRQQAELISAALGPLGPCNVQLRLSQGRPICFEVNVRFSGTTPLRAHFGFNEVEAAIRHFVLGEPSVPLPLVTEGIALRYWNEVYVDPRAHRELAKRGRLESPTSHPLTVESYGSTGVRPYCASA
jgi:carbamoyl-phosphate synthase large subunit